MSVWGIANHEKREEQAYAALGVQAMQTGQDGAWYFEKAAAHRATYYEFMATGDLIQELCEAKLAEIKARTARQTLRLFHPQEEL